MEGAALKPPVFTEYCTCGCLAIDHSLCWWDMLRLPDQHIVGPCGKCEDCHSFSYDGPPHESKLISLRDYNSAPITEEAEEVRKIEFPIVDVSRRLHVPIEIHHNLDGTIEVIAPKNVKVYNRVLSNEEIAQRVADLVLDCLENNTKAAAG